jgi:hypothetical protein
MSKEIRDDSPENSVESIVEILREESAALDARSPEVETRQEGMEWEVIVHINSRNSAGFFRVVLSYIESYDIGKWGGSIGSGLISGYPDVVWEIELFSRDLRTARDEGPFRWGLYPRGKRNWKQSPTHFLTGNLLRDLAKKTLGSQPAA